MFARGMKTGKIFHTEENVQEKPLFTEIGRQFGDIYLPCRMYSVTWPVTNNMLTTTPHTYSVFYLAWRDYSLASSTCNWHWLNEELQPFKSSIIGSKFALDFRNDIMHLHRLTARMCLAAGIRFQAKNLTVIWIDILMCCMYYTTSSPLIPQNKGALAFS